MLACCRFRRRPGRAALLFPRVRWQPGGPQPHRSLPRQPYAPRPRGAGSGPTAEL